MKSSLHCLIPFLSFLLNCFRLPSSELDPIFDSSLKRPSLSLYNASALTTQKTQHLCCWEVLFTDLVPEMDVLLLGALASAGTSLRSRCVAVGLYFILLYLHWQTLILCGTTHRFTCQQIFCKIDEIQNVIHAKLRTNWKMFAIMEQV
jgi:hypothetical protein